MTEPFRWPAGGLQGREACSGGPAGGGPPQALRRDRHRDRHKLSPDRRLTDRQTGLTDVFQEARVYPPLLSPPSLPLALPLLFPSPPLISCMNTCLVLCAVIPGQEILKQRSPYDHIDIELCQSRIPYMQIGFAKLYSVQRSCKSYCVHRWTHQICHKDEIISKNVHLWNRLIVAQN